MSELPHDVTASLRRSIYWLLIAVAIGNASGRILAVNSVDVERLESYRLNQRLGEVRKELEKSSLSGDALEAELAKRRSEMAPKLALQRPFLSGNDRSRWASVRALVEQGTFAIDEIVAQPGWDTIDMVKHKDRAGTPRLYSSKPPLTATLLAVPYWVIHQATGATLGTHPYEIGRVMLLLVNVLPAVLMFGLIAAMVDRLGMSDWGRIFAVAVATLATFHTTFIIVLNNHLHGAVSVTIAMYALLRIWEGDRRLRWFVLAGLFGAFAVTHELPALSFFGLLSLALLYKAPRETLLAYAPAALVVVVAYFGTNYVAHDSLRPPYAHRSATDPDDNWYDYTFTRNGREIASYWRDPQGIDRGEPSPGRYALHVLVGHHGIFSLTPVWILSVVGLVYWLTRGTPTERQLAAMIAILSVVCLAFYLARPQIDRNYGGMTSGFRWMFWFAPLWTLAMLPTLDRLAHSRIGRGFALVLLAFSVLSVSYPTWNPWTHPWLTKFMMHLGWVEF